MLAAQARCLCRARLIWPAGGRGVWGRLQKRAAQAQLESARMWQTMGPQGPLVLRR